MDDEILELKKEIYRIIKTSLEENPDGSVSYDWIVNLDRFTEIFFNRIEALEKNVKRHQTRLEEHRSEIDFNMKKIGDLEEELDSKVGSARQTGNIWDNDTCAALLTSTMESGGEKVAEISAKNDQKSLVSPYYACGEPKNHKTDEKLPEEDIRAITIKGNLYWMPKAEANALISEFVEKLDTWLRNDDNDGIRFIRLLRTEYEERINK